MKYIEDTIKEIERLTKGVDAEISTEEPIQSSHLNRMLDVSVWINGFCCTERLNDKHPVPVDKAAFQIVRNVYTSYFLAL